MEETSFVFSPENISKYWKLLNHSQNPKERKLANKFLSEFKQNCTQCIEIAMALFSSQSLEDKFISSLLLYQHIKENPNKLLKNKELFIKIKEFILNQALIPYTISEEKKEDDNKQGKSQDSLIIERVCYSMSIIILLGCCSYWSNAIDDMLEFGKQTLKHTYLMAIIFGNCSNELKDLYLSSKQEFLIKSKFIEKKEEFKNFINTIFININNIDKKLYNKAVDLAKNLTCFEVNILHIPNLIKVILNSINISNIDSLSSLLSESINKSKSIKLEDEYNDLDITNYDSKVDKDEILSFSYIIEIIISYVQTHNNPEEDIIFGLGKVFSSITENYIYFFFKKDLLSQKIFNLFFFFVSHKKRKISQLFFETIITMKNFINSNYKFSNYSQNEKIEFSNFLLKILLNITNNCVYKTIQKKQDFLLNGEYISINNFNKNEKKENEEDDFIDEINEITIEDYRVSAEDVFLNVFAIFAKNYGKDGVNYFFEQITKEIIPILNKPLNEIKEEHILSVEVILYVIKCIVSSFESLDLDKTPLNQFTLILIRSQILSNNFILTNLLLLLEEESTYFEYNKIFYSELIIFLLNQLTLKINEENSQQINILLSTVLLSICDSCNGLFIEEIWEKMYQVYINYYDKFSFLPLYNLTESLSSSLIIQEDESNSEDENNKRQNLDFLTNEEIIQHLKKIVEPPVLRILKIGEIIINKETSEIYEKQDMEKKIRLEIIKNFNVITCILKQSSFIEDKTIINTIFNLIYNKIWQCLSIIINDFHKDNEILHCIMSMLAKCSAHFSIDYLEQIFPKFNELMINSFLKNKDNYQCIFVLKNIYLLKLHNIKDKTFSNNNYTEIYNNFLKLNREICSAIITSSKYQLELMKSLSLLFVSIFPQLNNINKNDYVIISDTIILLNEGIKTLCENDLISNILYAFISFIESPNKELIEQKYNDIVKSVFDAFDHFNQNVLKSFILFCDVSIKHNKREFMLIFKEILNSTDFQCFSNDKKTLIYNYIEHFSDNVDKLKKIFSSILNIIQKTITESIDDIMERFYKELNNDINKIQKNTEWVE